MKNFFIGVFVFVVLGFAMQSEASMVKGSAGVKRYTYVSDRSGHSQLSLIYDNRSADLDAVIGFVNNEGDPVFLGTGLSTIQNLERIECGVGNGGLYFVIVDAYKGSSPFRLTISTAGDEFLSPLNLQVISNPHRGRLVEEKDWDSKSRKFLDAFRRAARFVKSGQ